MTDVDPEVLNKSLDEIIAASAGKRKTKAGGGAKVSQGDRSLLSACSSRALDDGSRTL